AWAASAACWAKEPDQRKIQCELLRDIFGNPFRPVEFKVFWAQNRNVVDLARSIYEERRFDELPLLAEALVKAGCDHEVILAHCRERGKHVRGCGVIDAIRGKR